MMDRDRDSGLRKLAALGLLLFLGTRTLPAQSMTAARADTAPADPAEGGVKDFWGGCGGSSRKLAQTACCGNTARMGPYSTTTGAVIEGCGTH